MFDFSWDLSFSFGLNVETLALIFNIGIPILYLANFAFLYKRLRGFKKDAPFYDFVKSLVYFFFFYGLGALFFVWYDFFYMDFASPSPLFRNLGQFDPVGFTEPLTFQMIHIWKIGILLQNVGLLLMLNQLRGKVLKGKIKNILPIVWQFIGITSMVLLGFVFLTDDVGEAYFWAEINYLFNFVWSISLPLTYRFIMKQSAGNLKKYAGILYRCLIVYGLAWGFRTRFAVHLFWRLFGWLGDANPFTFRMLWLIRAILIVLNLALVLVAYRKLLESFK
ncbi:MAG: hypothetical protein GF364_01245 [Candidatus Lokiarchaeota archaeon]|nr:hypothetical protein [Candidatus Lokiarchaeota archaeon]